MSFESLSHSYIDGYKCCEIDLSNSPDPEMASSIWHMKYEIYCLERNLPIAERDQASEKLVEDIDYQGIYKAILHHEKIVGLVLLVPEQNIPQEYREFYDIADCNGASIAVRLMVAKPYRKISCVSIMLMQAAFRYGEVLGTHYNYIDCNPPLRRYYLRFGYQEQSTKQHPKFGRVTILRLDLKDYDYLRKIDSPFLWKHHGAH